MSCYKIFYDKETKCKMMQVVKDREEYLQLRDSSAQKAMVLYVAQGEQWDKTLEDFIRWSEQYDLWCKMRFFGEAIDEANGESKPRKRGPKNLLDELPRRFTLEEAVAVRRRQNLPAEQTSSMLSNWKSRGYIAQDPDGEANVWVKVSR